MIFSLFLLPQVQTSRESIDDPELGAGHRFGSPDRYNIVYYRAEQITLDDGDTRTIALPAAATSNWKFLIARVVGEARVNTTGLDYDGSTPITGKLPMFGTSLYPGVGCISTYNVSALQVEGLADGTVVEIFLARAVDDADALLDSNA